MAISLRDALEEDQATIQAIILQVRINPMGIDWRRFVVAVDETGQLVGCGQIKLHGDGSCELASIAVLGEWRGQGIARAVIERLIFAHEAAHAGEPLFLTCRANLGQLYERFGFRRVNEGEMTVYFRRINRLARWIGKTGLMPTELWVMRRDWRGA